MRTSSEPLSHLDKPVIQLRIHKYFDNITKEFDIALIKFDEEGIEFQVSFSLMITLVKLPSRSLTSCPSVCLHHSLTSLLAALGSQAGASSTSRGG